MPVGALPPNPRLPSRSGEHQEGSGRSEKQSPWALTRLTSWEASAQETRLKNHTTTLAHEYSKQGRDWQDALRQRGKEVALMRELGLTDASAKPAAAVPARDVEDLSPEEMEEAAHALSR